MSLDKKSLIQIVILIVLIVGGVGAYLMQQEGGLGFITGFFESKPATIRAPAAKKPAPASVTPAQAPADKTAAKAVPPNLAAPATGQVQGKPFVVANSSIEGGALSLQSADAVEVKVMLPGSSWETPAGKNFNVTDTAGPDAPRVMVTAKGMDGQGAPPEQRFTDKYTLALEFGQEKDGKLPGKIQLSLPDEAKSHVAGSFEAAIRGFRIVDGKPDLSADSVDTLQYLALRELLKDDPNKALEVISFRQGRYAEAAPGKNMTGSIEVEYRIGRGSPVVQRFQFEKDAGAWKVVGAQRKKSAS